MVSHPNRNSNSTSTRCPTLPCTSKHLLHLITSTKTPGLWKWSTAQPSTRRNARQPSARLWRRTPSCRSPRTWSWCPWSWPRTRWTKPSIPPWTSPWPHPCLLPWSFIFNLLIAPETTIEPPPCSHSSAFHARTKPRLQTTMGDHCTSTKRL